MKKIKEILFLKNLRRVGKTTIYKKFWDILCSCENVDELEKSLQNDFSRTDLDAARQKTEDAYSAIEDQKDLKLITVFDENYPIRLNVMKEKRPLLLYCKGNTDILSLPNIALIGTRKPSPWSVEVEKKLTTKILDSSNRVIVSGLAIGCDGIAQETTVSHKRQTIAVLPSGVNRIYPSSHKGLADAILENNGCLISEYEPNAQFFKTTFIERDAVVAALSDITLVVECGVHSGTMHTVDYAHDYGRIIGCYYPKDTTKGDYSGNAFMMKNRGAIKVSDTAELLPLLNVDLNEDKKYERSKADIPHQMTLTEMQPQNPKKEAPKKIRNKKMDNKSIKKLESDLWESADLLRAGSKLTSNQYCMPVLGLIFLRYAYSRFKKVEAEILKDRPMRHGRVMPVEASDFAEKSALYLPREAQYDYLVNLPADLSSAGLKDKNGEPITSLGAAVNNAMALVEDQSDQLKGVLPKEYTIFSDELLSELLRIFNNNALDDVGGDVIGRIYEYFLNKFAKNVAQDDGVFFTPKSIVKMIVNILEPTSGILLDPACGSGGMFVQTGDFVNQKGLQANNTMTFYGQEKVEYNAQLCLMNMAVHGLTGVIKSGDDANTFYHDAHNLAGSCDYVMANPPFNVDKVKAESAQAAGRLPFGIPNVNKAGEFSNANYLWISYFYAYLNETGRAGFVMASSATDSQKKDKNIREKIVETGDVDVMISVGNNFFYTKSLPCTLWFFDRGKKESVKGKTLFIDARNYYTVVDRTLNEWTDWQLKNLTAIVWLYRGEVEKYKGLLSEYRDALKAYADETADGDPIRTSITSDFQATVDNLKTYLKCQRKQAKEEIEGAEKKDKKALQKKWDEKLEWDNGVLTVAKDALWLYEKFGDGEYQDIAGLCKIATVEDIKEKGLSLTPGAYVGVAPVKDDGVDFEERMKEIHKELLTLQGEANDLMNTISNNLEEMGL